MIEHRAMAPLGRAARLTTAIAAVAWACPVLASSSEDPIQASLEWRNSTDSSCLDAQALRGDVERHLGRPVFATNHPDVGVRVSLERQARDRLVVHIAVLRDGHPMGARTLEGSEAACNRLRAELALVVAMLVDIPRDELEQEAAASEPALAPGRIRVYPHWHGMNAAAGTEGFGTHPSHLARGRRGARRRRSRISPVRQPKPVSS